MKCLNNEQAILAILLLLLTSLSTISGSMPSIESIETYFEETKPNKNRPVILNEPVEGFKRDSSKNNRKNLKEHFGVNPGTDPQEGVSLEDAYGINKEDIKELSEGFHAHEKREHFGAHEKREHFGAHEKKEHFGAHEKRDVIEPFQGDLYATV